ncbi:MAG: serine--tRNA ligase, partial [Muribaculaceae bacterium]|nr:serine--tRNA ligase [Muribaculaceae bacterium]
MLTIQQIKENPDRVVEKLAIKGFDGREAIDKVLELDNKRRELQLNNDNQAAELNKKAAEI